MLSAAGGGDQRRLDEVFTGLVVEEGVDVRVEIVAGEGRVVVQGSDASRSLVRTEVHGGILHIDAPDAKGRSLVSVELPRLTVLTKHGAGLVDVRGLLTGELETSVDGDGDLRLRGTVRSLRVTVEDQARVEAKELQGAQVAIRHDGTNEILLGGGIVELVAAVRSSGPLTAEGLEGPVRITLSGSSKGTLTGPMTMLDASVTGTAALTAHGLIAEEVQVSVGDLGSADLAGHAARFDVRTIDGGTILADPLTVEEADIAMRGTGTVMLNATKKVTGLVHAGKLMLGSSTATVSVDVTGDGVVTQTEAP